MTAAVDADAGEASGMSRRAVALGAGAVVLLLTLVYAPILRFMAHQWQTSDDYSHGFLIVPLSLYFAYERKRRLAKAPLEGSWLGVPILVAGLLILAVGRVGVALPLLRGGYLVSLIGLVVLLLGTRATRILAFPLLFLFLMVPLPQSVVNTVTFPLQLLAASSAVASLHALGIPALLEGNIIHLANTELFVAEACSGLRSLMALITLGVVFAYFFRTRMAERVALVLSAIPIAILVNAFRVGVTGVLTHYYGKEAAGGFIHDFQGVITFGMAFFLLMAEARLFEWLWPHPPSSGRAKP